MWVHLLPLGLIDGASSAKTSTKIGGDDAIRYEIWEKPRKPEKRDEALDKVIREAYDKIRGITPPVTVDVVAKPVYDESDDEEAILLLM